MANLSRTPTRTQLVDAAERFGWLTGMEQQKLQRIAYNSFWRQAQYIGTERGKSREEYYSGSTRSKEPFGLHKRTRRLARGIACSHPDGNFYDQQAQADKSPASSPSTGKTPQSQIGTESQPPSPERTQDSSQALMAKAGQQ